MHSHCMQNTNGPNVSNTIQNFTVYNLQKTKMINDVISYLNDHIAEYVSELGPKLGLFVLFKTNILMYMYCTYMYSTLLKYIQ